MTTPSGADTDAPQVAPVAGSASTASVSRRSTATILIVDDTRANVDVLVQMVEAHGHEAAVAFNGETAIACAVRLKPDLVLLDVEMPGISGFETCRRLKADPATRDTPVVMITANSDHLALAFEVGAADFISKPVIARELYARIDVQLTNRALMQALAQVNQELRASEELLQTRVAERTAALEASNDELVAEMERRRLIEDRLEFLVRHDVLSRLWNRSGFLEAVNPMVADPERQGVDSVVGVRFADLHLVSAVHGHHRADTLVRLVVDRLRTTVPTGAILGRVGENEFVAYCPGVDSAAATGLARSLQTALRLDDDLAGNGMLGVPVVAEIGTDQRSAADVLQLIGIGFADSAASTDVTVVRRSANAGHDDRSVHDPVWIRLIRDAMEHGHFHLHSQLIVPNRADLPVKAELLLRMAGADGANLARPDRFLASAERHHLLADIDKWVVRRTIEHLRQGGAFPEGAASVTVNLTGQSLSDAMFRDWLLAYVEGTAPTPGTVTFEITETTAIHQPMAARRALTELRRLGCEVALDDFGSGEASFGYLRNFPVDVLKIDGTFIRDLVHDPVAVKLVRSMSDMGKALGLRTVAEWVETPAQADIVSELGIDYCQGYAFSRPAPYLPGPC